MDTPTVTGGAIAVAHDVAAAEFTASMNYAVATEGTLVYQTGSNSSLIRSLVWVDRDGNEIGTVGDPTPQFNPRISPDGTRLAVEIVSDANDGIEVYDLRRGGRPTRISFVPGAEFSPVWTPDSQRLVYANDGELGLVMRSANGTGAEEEILPDMPERSSTPEAITPDGEEILFRVDGPSTNDIYRYSFADGTAESLLASNDTETSARISPNSRWLAYASDESDQLEIYVRPYPNVEADKQKVSTNGGTEPLWSPDGKALYYVENNKVMVVSVETDDAFNFGVAEPLFTFDTSYSFDVNGAPNWDIDPSRRG